MVLPPPSGGDGLSSTIEDEPTTRARCLELGSGGDGLFAATNVETATGNVNPEFVL